MNYFSHHFTLVSSSAIIRLRSNRLPPSQVRVFHIPWFPRCIACKPAVKISRWCQLLLSCVGQIVLRVYFFLHVFYPFFSWTQFFLVLMHFFDTPFWPTLNKNFSSEIIFCYPSSCLSTKLTILPSSCNWICPRQTKTRFAWKKI